MSAVKVEENIIKGRKALTSWTALFFIQFCFLVLQWQIAQIMGISEPTMTRRLRKELPDGEKEELRRIIDEISQEQAETTESSEN